MGVNSGEVVVRSIQTGDAHTEYTPIGHSTSLAVADADARGAGLDRDRARACSKLVEGYFALKPLGAEQDQGRQRAGQRLRGDRARAAAHAACSVRRGAG